LRITDAQSNARPVFFACRREAAEHNSPAQRKIGTIDFPAGWVNGASIFTAPCKGSGNFCIALSGRHLFAVRQPSPSRKINNADFSLWAGLLRLAASRRRSAEIIFSPTHYP
jgi:hypothetical protein